ncbi:hypothetical protein ACFLUU_07035 [Chloroflexota bacterium]
MREAIPEQASHANHQILPIPYNYNFWQPWRGDYHGKLNPSYLSSERLVADYVCTDSVLKESMER